MTLSGPMREGGWHVTDDLIDAVTKDLQASTGYAASALSRRIDMALDRLDARHLDDLAHILGLVTLQLRKMAMERSKQEDAEQEREYAEMQARATGRSAIEFNGGPFPGARWTGALD